MNCPYCQGTNLEAVFQADIPTILSACPESFVANVRIAPFEVTLCKDCFLGFNSKPLRSDDLRHVYENYLYISPLAGIGTSKYVGMLDTIARHVAPDAQVVEIGCSEGYLLKNLKERGYRSLVGFEPGPQAETARSFGLTIRREFFAPETIGRETFDAFVLMHVFEHFDAPWLILGTLKRALKPSGRIIIEIPDFCGFHHQHLFFFHSRFFERMARDNGLKIIERALEKDALRVVLAHHDDATATAFPIQDDPQTLLRTSREKFATFRANVQTLQELFTRFQDKDLYCWGAGSATVIYLNQIPPALRHSVRLHLLDGDRQKWNNVIPGTSFRVRSFKEFAGKKLDKLIIVSSFAGEIRQTMASNGIQADSTEVFY